MKLIVLHYQCDQKQVYSISTNQTLEEHHRENEEEIKNPTGSQIQPFFSPNFIFLDGDDSRAVSSDKGTDGLPYLQKVYTGDEKLRAAAYDLSGLIYFKNKQEKD